LPAFSRPDGRLKAGNDGKGDLVADRAREKPSAAGARTKRWLFPYFAFSAGILSFLVGGLLGAALAFGIAAALAWRTGRSSALRWTLMTLAVLCMIALMIIILDAWSGIGTLTSSSG
jgi:hypothetical protein